MPKAGDAKPSISGGFVGFPPSGSPEKSYTGLISVLFSLGWQEGVTVTPAVSTNEKCELAEYDGLPTAEALRATILRNQPVIFRGAANGWDFQSKWTKTALLEAYVRFSKGICDHSGFTS